MDLDALVATVGVDRYRRACHWAWRTAAGTGRRRDGAERWPDGLADVPHELAEEWHGLDLALGVLADMPCYANTMPLRHAYAELPDPERARLWAAYRAALQDPDDRRADPVAYSLWVDFLEDADTVADAWTAMVAGERDDRRLARLLAISGPVPWALKGSLLERLGDDPAWRTAVLRALDMADRDVYGQTDPEAAARLRRRLG